MATGSLTPIPRYRAIDSDGNPISGAKLNTYAAGTSTPLATYSDSALTVANTNPVVADAGGLFGPIYLSQAAYKLVLTTSAGVSVWSQDNVTDPLGIFSGNVTVGGTLGVTGAADIDGALDVAGDVKTVAWTDYSATSTLVGWSALAKTQIFYKKIGKLVFVFFQIEGTSNATNATFTLPVARVTAANLQVTFPLVGDIQDNGAAVTTNAYGKLDSAASTVTTFPSAAGGNWTNSGAKRIAGQFVYEAAS